MAVMMEKTPFLPLPEGMFIEQIQTTETGLVVSAISTRPTSCCPLCTRPSPSVHSYYRRSVRDVPCGGRSVRLLLTVRKFFCHNTDCQRKIFTERLPAFVEPWAKMTIRLCEEIEAIGLSTSGSLGARLASRLGIDSSWMTVLRRIMDIPTSDAGSVVALGIDDFSFRRGRKFGTILVNLDKHQVIDLLAERSSKSTADWMRRHPEIDSVSRDRGKDYAQGATEGAPQATQISDRFHLTKNLVEAVETEVSRCYKRLRQMQQPSPSPDAPQVERRQPVPASEAERKRLVRLANKQEQFEQVKDWQRRGLSQKEIAQRLGMAVRTVQRWQELDACPGSQRRRKRRSIFDPYAPDVLSRWQQGCRSVSLLWREIHNQGFEGTERTVYRFVRSLRQDSPTLPAPSVVDHISVQVDAWRPAPDSGYERKRLARLANKQEQFEQVKDWQRRGLSQKEIAQRLGMAVRTVQRWQELDACPGSQRRRKRRSIFDPYAPDVLSRWQQGCRSVSLLWQEIHDQGFKGTDRTVYRFVQSLRQDSLTLPLLTVLDRVSVQQALWLIVRPYEKLKADERKDLEELCQASQELTELRTLVQSFGQMVRKREGHRLQDWMKQVADSGFLEVQKFAKGLERDKEEVLAGLTFYLEMEIHNPFRFCLCLYMGNSGAPQLFAHESKQVSTALKPI